jgi:hypothetical protein
MPRAANATSETGRRYPLNMRTTKALRDKLDQAKSASGRSLLQEVEHRVENSFRMDELFGGAEMRRVVFLMAAAVQAGQHSAGPDVPPKEWLQQPAATITAIANVVHVLASTLTPFRDHAALNLLDQAIQSRIAGLHAALDAGARQ